MIGRRRYSMKKIEKVTQLTHNPYLNLYELSGVNKKRDSFKYFVSSRAKKVSDLKITTKNHTPDGVFIYSLYGEKQDHVILVRQYRYSIDDYIYEFPAGLVESDENYKDAAIREMKEETGLTLETIEVDEMYEKPYFTTIGMTDESCATVYGYAKGTPNLEGLEDNEELEVVIADREEVKRILKEERASIMCACMLMHFVKDTEDPFAFLRNN
jgi:ADP-ribose pyrophosphatase